MSSDVVSSGRAVHGVTTAAEAMNVRSAYPRTRRIRFPFGEGSKYFVNNDMVFSHFVANLSGAFPPGRSCSFGRCAGLPMRSPIRC